RSPPSASRMAPAVTMNTSSLSRVCDWSETWPGATVICQVHTSAEPRLGAAKAVNSVPGRLNFSALVARMTFTGVPLDRQLSLSIMDAMSSGGQVDFGILLAAGYQEFVRQLRASLAEQGFGDLGRSDGYVLRALAGRPQTVSALAERLAVTKQGAAQLVEAMEAHGYVSRQ